MILTCWWATQPLLEAGKHVCGEGFAVYPNVDELGCFILGRYVSYTKTTKASWLGFMSCEVFEGLWGPAVIELMVASPTD
jgi:hypothetical protein